MVNCDAFQYTIREYSEKKVIAQNQLTRKSELDFIYISLLDCSKFQPPSPTTFKIATVLQLFLSGLIFENEYRCIPPVVLHND